MSLNAVLFHVKDLLVALTSGPAEELENFLSEAGPLGLSICLAPHQHSQHLLGQIISLTSITSVTVAAAKGFCGIQQSMSSMTLGLHSVLQFVMVT